MRITGFASGLDTDSMVRDLMRAERAPLDKLFQKKEWLNWQRDAYRDVNLKLDTFRKSHENLRLQSSFNGFKASSSDTTVANVTAKPSAVGGSYDLIVSRLAEVAKVTTTNAIKKSDGTGVKSTDKILTPNSSETSLITVNGQDITITAEMTYADLAHKITNLTDSSGNSLQLRASFDDTTSRFVISSKNTGENQTILISDKTSPPGGTHVNLAQRITAGGLVNTADSPTTVQVTGKDSLINFNGVDIKSTTNKVSAFGVELDLIKPTPSTIPATSIKVTVTSDTTSIFDNIKKFVEDYNALIDSLSSKVKEKRNRDFAPLTDEQRSELSDKEVEKWDEKAKSGLLYNDPILREALSTLRERMYKPVESLPEGGLNLLSEIGITTQYMAVDGKLQIDENKLREAIANDPDGVMNLFTADDGIGTRVNEEVNKQIDKLNKKAGRPNTLTTLDISTIGNDLIEVNKQMSRWEDKLAQIEDRYWKRFTAMEKAISKMNEQSSMFATGM